MDETTEEKFLYIKALFIRMSHEEMCVVVESYYIWRTLTFARSIPEVGKEKAENNAKLVNLYKEFFIPTEQSHLQTFILGLMKFFDKDSRALSINALIKQIEENKDVFTSEILESIHPHLKEIGAITQNYLPISQESIDYFEKLYEKHKNLINNLKDIRDKQFAHTDMQAIEGTFVPNEIEELIEDLQEMFNKLSHSFDISSTIWNYLKEDSIRSTRLLLENLERGEIQRLVEIKRKWG